MLSALTLLLTCTFTCVGLLALWAAMSERHWFVRTAVFLGTLSPLLVIPAYEPLVALTAQGATIIVAVKVTQWLRNRKLKKVEATGRGLRFGMADLLLATSVVAYLVAIIVALPNPYSTEQWTISAGQNLILWLRVGAVGLLVGLVVFFAWFAVEYRGKWRWLVWVVGVVVSFALACIVPYLDGIVEMLFVSESMINAVWPPVVPQGVAEWILAFMKQPGPKVWTIAGVTLYVMTSLLCLLLFRFEKYNTKRFTQTSAMLLLCLLACFPLRVYWRLANPPEIPTIQLPEPNGYDLLVALAKQTETSSVNQIYGGVNPPPRKAKEKAAAEVLPVVDQARDTLRVPSIVPRDYSIGDDVDVDNISASRSLARSMREVADVAALNGEYEEAAAVSLDLMRYGAYISRGGLLIDELVGTACSGIALQPIYDVHQNLTAEQRSHVARGLIEYSDRLEPLDAIFERDRIWTCHTYGWVGRLNVYFDELVHNNETWSLNTMRESRTRGRMKRNMLITAFAIEDYRARNDKLPDTLEAVESTGARETLIDPLDPAGGNFRYRKLDEQSYLLYSLGNNGTDEKGEYSLEDYHGDSNDVTLESLFEDERLRAEAAAAETAEQAATQAELEGEMEDLQAQP